MNRTDKAPGPDGVSPDPKPRLSNAERGELQRQGAKAAARGDPIDTNPLGLHRNKPPVTGESDARWSQRSHAWEQGYEAQSVVRQSEHGASQRDADEHD